MHKNAQKNNAQKNFLPLHMATPWSNLPVSLRLSQKFFNCKQAQQKANHCNKKKRKGKKRGKEKEKNSKIEKPRDVGHFLVQRLSQNVQKAQGVIFGFGIKLLAQCLSAPTGQESTELKKGQLFNKLRHTVDPGAISTLVEELHQLEKGRRHSEVSVT